jgi:hypothetical protein
MQRRNLAGVAVALVAVATVVAAVRSGATQRSSGATQPTQTAVIHVDGDTAVDFDAIVRGIRPRGFGVVPYKVLTPAVGSRSWIVDPKGNDSDDGTAEKPLRTIARAAELAKSGDVVTIGPGSYTDSVVVRNSGAPSLPIVFQAAERGSVVLTGGVNSFRPLTWSAGAPPKGQWYVTVRGLIFRRFSNPLDRTNAIAAVRASKGWTIQDVMFDEAGRTGLEIRGNDVTVENSTFRRNYENALIAWGKGTGSENASDPRYTPLTGLVVRDVVLEENNTTPSPLTGNIGEYVAKFTGTRGAVIDNIESFGNNGNGFWFDKRNANYTIENSYFHDNRGVGGVVTRGRGLFIEVNWPSGIVRNNVFRNNSGAGLTIANSQSVDVHHNLMVGNAQCVTFISADRGNNKDGAPRYPLRDVNIHDNVCGRWKIAGIATVGGTFSDTPAQSNVVVDRNSYAPSTSRIFAQWSRSGKLTTLDDVRKRLSWEKSGSLAPLPDR